LFKVVREMWGANLESFVSEKVIAVPGDISYDNLGVNDCKRRQAMWKEIDIILNSTATTSFDES
jgi:fatty acyl-CoA reductase